jgi:predicted membrane protein
MKNFEKNFDDDRSISIKESNVVLKINNKEKIFNFREIKLIKIERVEVFSFKMIIFNSILFLLYFLFIKNNCTNLPSNFELLFFLVFLLLSPFFIRVIKYQILIMDTNLKHFKYKIHKKEMNDARFFTSSVRSKISK